MCEDCERESVRDVGRREIWGERINSGLLTTLEWRLGNNIHLIVKAT